MSAETIIIDPAGMNIVNRIAPGTSFSGTFESEGGLLVQGRMTGKVTVKGGPLVLMQDGVMSGDIDCADDAFLFGQILTKEDGEPSEMVCRGVAFLAETLEMKANFTAADFRLYTGAQVDGRFRSLKRDAGDAEKSAG